MPRFCCKLLLNDVKFKNSMKNFYVQILILSSQLWRNLTHNFLKNCMHPKKKHYCIIIDYKHYSKICLWWYAIKQHEYLILYLLSFNNYTFNILKKLSLVTMLQKIMNKYLIKMLAKIYFTFFSEVKVNFSLYIYFFVIHHK